jgi:DNA-binding PucR family transcriptional regulator
MTPDQLVEFAEGLSRVAASGGGPTAMAAHLADVTGAGVLIEDAEWRHIATAGSATLPASARGLNGGRVCTVPIAAGAGQLGFLSLWAAKPEDAGALAMIARLAASSLAVELARDAGGIRGRRRAFWERLIGRGYHDSGSAREDALARGITLAPSYVCVALESEDVLRQAQDETVSAELRSCAAEVFHVDGDAILDRGTALVVFVPATREVDAENARTAATLLPKALAKRPSALRVSGGIAPVTPVFDLHQAVERAEATLAIARRLYGGGKIAGYNELGAYGLLYSGASVDELRAFSREALFALRAYDEKHQTELERTLRFYFDSGENVKTTAAGLNVHRHTVFYRLRQIAEISGRALESPHDQLTLRLAIAIDALYT